MIIKHAQSALPALLGLKTRIMTKTCTECITGSWDSRLEYQHVKHAQSALLDIRTQDYIEY